MATDTTDTAGQKRTDAPATYRTPQRSGQSGAEDERRSGPNPRSLHPSGPHEPYEPHDPEGLAAEKHRAPDPSAREGKQHG